MNGSLIVLPIKQVVVGERGTFNSPNYYGIALDEAQASIRAAGDRSSNVPLQIIVIDKL